MKVDKSMMMKVHYEVVKYIDVMCVFFKSASPSDHLTPMSNCFFKV